MAALGFSLPPVFSHPDGWGPPAEGDNDGLLRDVFNCAYEHLDKYPQTRVSKICDFTQAGLKYQEQRLAKGKGKGKTPINTGAKDDEGFALVDSRPLPNKTYSKGRGAGFKGKGKGLQVNYQEGILGQKQKPFYTTQAGAQKGAKGKGKQQKGGGRGGQIRRSAPSYKEWSVQTKAEWPMKREIQLGELPKLQCDAREVKTEDLFWCGELRNYNKDYDRLSVAREQTVRRFEELNFFNVTTSDDPWLPDLIQSDPEVNVIATDHVLACIIAGARSIYSWDLVVTKVSGKIIIDKRDGSQVDWLSVNETANDPPQKEDADVMNRPVELSQEASCLNQNFGQMVLERGPNADVQTMEYPNPFEDDEEEESSAASGAYRYRKITIPGNPKSDNEAEQKPVVIALRTEVNAKTLGTGDKEQYVSIKALNEYDPKINTSWRKHLETQRGAILATELKNNAFKIARWTAQAVLSGCDVMKIGYASRIEPKDQWRHSVLAVQTYLTDGFASQIGMHANNVYGILGSIIRMVMQWEDGKYLLVKDPMKLVIRFFEVPFDTFADDDLEQEEEEEEGPDVDEEGRPIPQQ